jgi:signal transduction histidine kinase
MSARRRLSQLLLASHLGLVLLFALLLLATGVGTIRSAVSAQARAEAERALDDARRRAMDWERDLRVTANLIGEQPTLPFYLERGQFTKARALVARFQATSGVDYIQVTLRGRTIAENGPRPPDRLTGLAFGPDGTPWRIAQGGFASVPDATVIVAERLGTRLQQRVDGSMVRTRLEPLAIGLAAELAGPRDGGGDRAWTAFLRRVSESGQAESVESLAGSAVARAEVLRDEVGEPQALLSTRLAPAWVDRRIIEWLASFGLFGLLIAGLALGLGVVLAARISRPFAQLAGDAARLGAGDLDTPIAAPQTFLAEPLALAEGLEDMRRRVASLTATERSQREELDAVLDGVEEGIAGVDADGRVHYANRQFLALTGLAREDILGQSLDAVLPDGGRLTVRRYAASDARQVVVAREQNAIEAARVMRDHILANLSHEFQTPLSAQIASIELLREHLRASDDRVAVQLADAQYRGSMRLSQLVDNLLDSVRIESGEMRLRQQPVDVSDVVADAIALMQPLVDQRDQRVEQSLLSGPAITGDSPRLASVMVNLLANANKFAPDGTTIWVEMERDAASVTVWVEDEGPGLPPLRDSRDLFAPFRRSPHEEPSQRGTGLGLAIVHAIVLAHGGEVRIAEPRRGKGARIGVVLPVGNPVSAARSDA